jgi:ATP-dependent Clp protease protease subunit
MNKLEDFALDNRLLFIWTEINENMAADIIEQMQYMRMESNLPIKMYINSYGGFIDAEGAILDEMLYTQEQGIVVETVALGVAYSAAATLLAFGTLGYRKARPLSTIMIHPARYEFMEDYGGYQQKMMRFLDKREKTITKLLAKRCGQKNYQKFLQDIDKGLWLSSEEALTYGVIDSIDRGTLYVENKIAKKKNLK